MKVDTQQHGSVTVLVPRGAITEPELEHMERALGPEQARAGSRLVIDMSHVPYVDSAGIEFLLKFAGSAPSAGLRPRLASLSDTVREALDLTGTLKKFYRFDAVESAVRSYM
jgi:anti-anti-sigma factor